MGWVSSMVRSCFIAIVKYVKLPVSPHAISVTQMGFLYTCAMLTMNLHAGRP